MVMVDELRKWPTNLRCFQAGACHLTTDGTLEELHAFAARIGLARRWFQDHAFAPHYDLTPARRAKALTMGAIEVKAREQVYMRRARGIGLGLKTYREVSGESKREGA